MTATDKFYLWTGVNLTAGDSVNSFKAELDIEGTTSGNYDSTVTIPLPTSTNALPTVSVTAPANNATFAVGANITIAATAADSDGTISKVEFYQGVTKLGEDAASPYSFIWNNVAAGSYQLTAKAIDNAGGVKTSSIANITVNTSSISGRVTRTDGTTGINGATVKIYQGNTTVETVTTNSSGNFASGGLSPGSYVLEVVASGYKRQTKPGITVSSGTVSTVNFSLEIDAGPIVYAYDELGQLISATTPATGSVVYSYDETGNLLSISRQSVGQVFISNFTPNRASVGTPVTIFGSGFSTTPEQNTVKFNDVAAVVTSATARQITVNVPVGATSGQLSVTAPGGTAVSSTPFTVVTGTTITGISPTVGVADTPVEITGSGFATTYPGNDVKFNITDAVITANTATSISTSVPATATSGKITITNQSGTFISNQDFFVPPSPYNVSNVDVAALGRVTVGSSRSVSLNANGAGKIGMILFDGSVGQKLNLKINGTGIPNTKVTVYDPNGVITISGQISGNGAIFDLPNIKRIGTHMILLAPQDSNQGNLTLSLNATLPDTNLLLANGLPVTTSITKPKQTVALKFDASIGQHIKLAIIGKTLTSGNILVQSPNGEHLKNTALFNYDQSFDFEIVRATGLYSVQTSSEYSMGSITFALSQIADVTGSITPGTTVPLNFTDNITNARLTFEATAADHVRIDFSGITVAATLTLYNSNWEVIAREYSSPGQTDFIDVPAMPAAGTYLVLLNPYVTARNPSATGNINTTLSRTSNAAGTVVVNGPPLSVNIANPGDHAQFTFNAAVGQRIRLAFNSVTIPSASITVKNPSGTTIATSPLNTRGALLDIISAPETGVYTVQITVDGGSTGGMSVVATTVSAGSDIPIVLNGLLVTPVVTASGQTPVLNFTANVGQRINFSTAGAFQLTGNTTLKNPDGTVLTTLPLWSNYYQPMFVSGNFTATINPSTGTTGSATFSLSATPPVSASPFISGSQGSFSGGLGQNVWLSFDGTAGQKASLNVYNQTSSYINYSVSVYGPDGSMLISPTLVGDVYSPTFIDSFDLPLTGRYSVLLDPGDTYSVRGLLTLYTFTDVAGTIAAGGSPVSVTAAGTVTFNSGPAKPGQNARLTFTGTAGQRIYLAASRTSQYGKAVVSLLSPNGSVLGNSILLDTATSGATDPQTLSQNGTYTILIDPIGRSGITANLSLFNVPQDQTGNITIGGSPVSVNITAARQKVKLTFAATASQHIKLVMSGVTIPSSNVKIFKSDGSTLGNQPNGPAIGALNVGTSGGTIDVARLPVNDTYSIVVTPTVNNTGAMTLTLSEVSDLTGSLPIGGATVPVNIINPNQNARITFSATAGQHLKLTTSNLTLAGGFITIYKPDGSPFLLRDGYSLLTSVSNGNTIILPYIPITGTYQVFIDPLDANTGNIDLTLSAITDLNRAIVVGGAAVPVNVTTSGQNVKLTFSATAGQHLSLRMSAVTVSSSNIQVYKPDGTSVSAQMPVSTSGGYFDIPIVPVTGTYTIIADLLENTGNMTFTLSAITDLTGSITPSGPPVNINITAARQNARYSFSGTIGQCISLNLTGVTIANSNVSIINPDGTTLFALSDIGTSGRFLEDIVLPQNGTYTVLVDPNSTSIGAMTLNLYNTPEISGTIAAGGSSVPLTISAPGQNARLILNGTANQRVTILVANNTSSFISVQLIAPDNSQIVSDSGFGNITLPTQTLPVNGNYTIFIDSNNTATGTLTVIVTNP